MLAVYVNRFSILVDPEQLEGAASFCFNKGVIGFD